MQGPCAAVREIMVNSQLSTTGFSYSKHLDYGTQAYMGELHSQVITRQGKTAASGRNKVQTLGALPPKVWLFSLSFLGPDVQVGANLVPHHLPYY